VAVATDIPTRASDAVHVLTLTPFYPMADDDAQGCFVAEPLSWVEKLGVRNTVIAAQPMYRGRVRAANSAVPARWDHYFALPGGIGLPTAGAFLYASILAQVRRLHRDHSVHVIHAHAALPCGHAAALLSRELGIPFVVTVHGLDAFSTNQVKGRAGQWCRRVSQWVYGSANQVICISEKVREQVLQGAPQAKTTVIYNGVDPVIFSPDQSSAASNVILSVGNLIPVKGHELLLRAFAAINDRNPTATCVIIGDGPERPGLSRLAGELGIASEVRFMGRQSRSNVTRAMRGCAVFALPSRYEGLGCVYLEAMSASKPVIACRRQGIDEIIQHSVNGWLTDPDDLPGLTSGLDTLLQNQQMRRQMGEVARRTIQNGLTLAHQAERLVRVYQECRG
jgi:glycosyltransferase involved in cell wall biosynthesis